MAMRLYSAASSLMVVLLASGCNGSRGAASDFASGDGLPGDAGSDSSGPTERSGSDASANGSPGDSPIAARDLDGSSDLPGERLTDLSRYGSGVCSDTTLNDVVTTIHEKWPQLADIVDVYDPSRLGDGSYIYAFAAADSFQLVLKRGRGDCPAGCTENEYWYFATDASSCTPKAVGQYSFARGGPNCIATTGEPMWGVPEAPSAGSRCSAEDRDGSVVDEPRLDANVATGAEMQPVFDGNVTGTGPCGAVSVGAVIAAIGQGWPELSNINQIHLPSSLGDGSFIYAFQVPGGFRLVVKRGGGDCPAGCTENEYWYFVTDEACTPKKVGFFSTAPGTPNCIRVSGEPLWDVPNAPNLASRCVGGGS